jgi:predicted MPP superfamily phosphohydrolase
MHLLGFFGTIFLLFSLLSIYLFVRGWQALPDIRSLRIAYLLGFVSLTLLPWLVRTIPGAWAQSFIPIGYIWIVAALYLGIIAGLCDILRLIHLAAPIYPRWVAEHYREFKSILLLSSLVITGLLLLCGHVRFRSPEVTRYELQWNQPAQKPIHIVAVSDLHLGETVGAGILKQWVQKINTLKPDIILMAGDITDRGANDAMVRELTPLLAQLNAPMGVYAIPGNHDHYGRQRVPVGEFLGRAGIRYLQDEVVRVDSLLYIAGREDNRRRKSLDSLLCGLQPELPVILLDHRPDKLDEAWTKQVDLQISGHTHRGQIWPVSLIVDRMYPLSHGYLRRDQTQYIVSSGLGLWGPPFRIGTISEIISITIR